MRKFLALMTLTAALVVASSSTNHTAIAQGTKKDKDKTTTKGTGHIEIGKGRQAPQTAPLKARNTDP